MTLGRFSQPEPWENYDREGDSEREQEMADRRRDDEIDRQMDIAEQQKSVMDKMLKQILP
jgi:hypothetical protein